MKFGVEGRLLPDTFHPHRCNDGADLARSVKGVGTGPAKSTLFKFAWLCVVIYNSMYRLEVKCAVEEYTMGPLLHAKFDHDR